MGCRRGGRLRAEAGECQNLTHTRWIGGRETVRVGGLLCHTKTMMNREDCEAQRWTPIMCHLGKRYMQKDMLSGTTRMSSYVLGFFFSPTESLTGVSQLSHLLGLPRERLTMFGLIYSSVLSKVDQLHGVDWESVSS